jgi:hypothetical protein
MQPTLSICPPAAGPACPARRRRPGPGSRVPSRARALISHGFHCALRYSYTVACGTYMYTRLAGLIALAHALRAMIYDL